MLFTVLAIVLGLARLVLIQPIFDVLFNQLDQEKLAEYEIFPKFEFSSDYVTHYFYYQLIHFRDEYSAFGALVFVCGVIILSTILYSLFTYLANMELNAIRVNAMTNLRQAVFDKVSRLHLGYFTNERKGDLMSRVTNDVGAVEGSIINSITVFFREPATIIVYFILLFSYSLQLTLFTILVLPVSGFIISGIAKRLKKPARESQESLGRIVNLLDETLGGMRIVKAFTARTFIQKKFDSETQHYGRTVMHIARRSELASPVSESLGIFFVAAVLIYGGNLVLSGQSDLTAAEFFTYVIVFTQVLQPGKAISKSFTSIQRGLSAGERIFSVMDIVPAIRNAENAVVLPQFSTAIELKDVDFHYGENQVLKKINLRVEKGQTVALVGPSGGGKSTLADLIPRFYDPTGGEVLLDGKPLTAYEVESLRKQLGIVTQESILFNDTVFNNIAFGMPEATNEQVTEAAKVANAHEFIAQMPEGYYTTIGERGGKLSGGQRQRLSIARAVLKNPPILILDEATSALDSHSEKLVQEALTHLMEGRTSVVIAHRLSTIQHADKIVVIKYGEIVEEGTHEELVARDGLYKKLTLMQTV
jgi:subfamily B ATP-binding cassette protein MsbA